MFEQMQRHTGSGDNVGRDKIIHNHLYGSVDYQQLIADIAEAEEDLREIPADNIQRRIKKGEKLAALRKQVEDFKANVFRLYEQFTSIPINTARRRLAKAHFDKGEFREADAVLKAEEINADVAQHKARRAAALETVAAEEQNLAELANEFVLKAQLALVNPAPEGGSRFQQAEQWFEQALAAARIAEVLHEYALFLYEHNAFRKAEPLYQEALKLCRSLAAKNPEAFLPDVATTLNNLANLYSDQNAFGPALAAYEEALQIRHSLAEKNPEAFLLDVAMTLNNLGGLYRQTNAFAPALAAYEEALKHCRSLAAKNPEAFLPDVAGTLNNLGILHSDQNAFAPALAAYEEALQIRRSLAAKNPEAFLPDVAGTLNNLAALHYAQNSFTAAQAAYEEALQIKRSLAAKNPEAFLPRVADTLNNLGILHSDQNAFAPALAAYEEALQIRRSLAEAEPEAFLPVLTETMINFSIFYFQDVLDAAKSIAFAEEARSILIPLCAQAPHLQDHLDMAERVLEANATKSNA